jgi:DNA segregation ATPase FtsK/SpoIIIE, S-DNA-T family
LRVSVGAGPVRFGGLWALLVWLVGWGLVGVGRVFYAAVCRPRTTGAVLGLVTVWCLFAAHPVAVTVAVFVVSEVLHGWAVLRPASFRRRVGLRALAWCRSVLVYRRLWQRAMRAADLTVDDERVPPRWRVPRLGRVRCLESVDVVQVRGLLGQRGGMWEDAGPMLAHVFGASDVRVHRGDDRRLTLELRRARRGRSWHRSGVLELEQ